MKSGSIRYAKQGFLFGISGSQLDDVYDKIDVSELNNLVKSLPVLPVESDDSN